MKHRLPTGRPASERAISRSLANQSPGKLILCCCLLLLPWLGKAQTTYYVSATGNDGNSGRTVAQAFQSLGKVSSLALQPGDSVLFKRGDTFRGTLQISRSGAVGRPIVFAAYGAGNKPVLSGSIPLTGWTRTSANANVWQANCAACGDRVTGVHRSEVALPLGRYPNADTPNKGYLTIYSHNQKYQIVSVETLPKGLAGGEVAMRPTQWIIDRAIIDAQYDNALNLFNNSNYYPADGWGFFIQNHPKTLDQSGEWCYTPSSKTILLFDSLANPNSQAITATVNEKGVDMYNASNVVLRNLHLAESLATAVAVSNSSSFSLVGVDMVNSGEDGLIITGSGRDVLVDNCKLLNTNNNGIYVDGNYRDVILRNNTLRRVGVLPGRGKSGDGQYNGIQSVAQNVLIENNVIDSVGYNGITFWNNTTIRQNVISNYCMTKSDGGGLYAFNGNKAQMENIHLLSNIIYNGLGAPEGSYQKQFSGANGILLDNCVQHVDIGDNTVFQNHQWGIYLHATNNVQVHGNTSFNNGMSQFTMYHDAGLCVMRGHDVQHNIFVGREARQIAIEVESNADDLQQYGVFDNNYYASVFINPNNIQAVVNSYQYARITLDQWRARFGHDLHSRGTPIQYPEYLPSGGDGVQYYGENFQTSLGNWYTWSPYGNGKINWTPSSPLDGGSMKISFSPPSGKTDSYQIPSVEVGSLAANDSFSIKFDAVSPDSAQTVQVYFRQKFAPYQDVSNRATLTIGTTRSRQSATLITTMAETQTILIVQAVESSHPIYLDNLAVNQGTYKRLPPDEYAKLLYNPTLRDTTLTMAGNYRDVKNNYYKLNDVVKLKPFTSLVLIKDTLPPADLRLILKTNRLWVPTNGDILLTVQVQNQTPAVPLIYTQWKCKLPPNLQVVDMPPNVMYAGGELSAFIAQMTTPDSAYTIRLRPTVAGTYAVAAQLTLGNNTDPDSRVDSGTGDGEDDTATTLFRVGGPGSTAIFVSPNPYQLPLPAVVINQPPVDPTKTDLQLTLALSRRVVAANDTLTANLTLTNTGGAAASAVGVQVQLPAGVTFLSGNGWSSNGTLVTAAGLSVPAGGSVIRSIKLKTGAATSKSAFVLRAQVLSSDKPDSDSTAGNGYLNGEDDEAQADLRLR
ncbi:right-handed parallel beta-helix repeat-containing protein [Fibrella aquatilis]|uniref:Right-handed parallel beta-helix repeat-containing protein n=1 Tax=Fibrella aquatilis TaxID=2817059 RepID=A0A939G7R9_9BACT|nr:right-handed parallel beta-helix repeat-containing protein [Fibrella aquatilis]MBO0932570.1 right-handed parallel beta-helix repeat-containing protein [Fibrella aquatilis]